MNLFTATGWGAGARWGEYAKRNDDWYRGDEGGRVTANILSHQSKPGSWPKNLDTSAALYTGDAAKLQGTFDIGATTGELRFLARAFRTGREPKCEAAFLKGFDHILRAQYPNSRPMWVG